MTNLPPQKPGQAMEMLITGEDFDPVERGTWYSPAAVARMIEKARREEREQCEKLYGVEWIERNFAKECARLKRITEAAQAATTGGEDHMDHFVVPSHLMAALALALDETCERGEK
jgi:hypothetical protein